MRVFAIFIAGWLAASVGLYALLQSQGAIRPEETQVYMVGSGAVGLILAFMLAAAVAAR